MPSSRIPFTLMMKATRSSEKSVLTRAICHHIPEDGIPHSHRREYLKSYKETFSETYSSEEKNIFWDHVQVHIVLVLPVTF
jgi:hypothetical protein